jgi:hypothetical protein
VLTVRDNELGVGGIGDASSELAGGRGKALWLVWEPALNSEGRRRRGKAETVTYSGPQAPGPRHPSGFTGESRLQRCPEHNICENQVTRLRLRHSIRYGSHVT